MKFYNICKNIIVIPDILIHSNLREREELINQEGLNLSLLEMDGVSEILLLEFSFLMSYSSSK